MKKSPIILAGCGCASLIASLILFASAFFLVQDDRPAAEDMLVYRNTPEGRTGALADAYVDFEFRYPKTWQVKPPSESNFVAVEHSENGNTIENFNVGYFKTAGSSELNRELYPQLIATLQNQFAQQFEGLRKVSEGPMKVGEYDAYQGLFASKLNGADLYTRVVLLPTSDGTKGVALILMGTSYSPDLESPEDLGRQGELPLILESFRFTG